MIFFLLSAPNNPKEAVVDFLSTLSDRSILLALDNFETPFDHSNSDAIQLLNQLRSPAVVIMVTYRGARSYLGSSIEFERAIALHGLDIEDALSLYGSLKGSNLDVKELADLSELLILIDRMPLAIRVISALSDPPRALIKRWNDLDLNLIAGPSSGADPRTSVSKSIELSLQSESLRESSPGRRLLQLLSCLPAGLSDTDTALASIGVLSSQAFTESEARKQRQILRGAADLLVHRALVNKQAGRLTVLSPVRLYMQQAEFDRAQLNAYFTNLVQDRDIYEMPGAEVALLRLEVPNLCASIRSVVESMSVSASVEHLDVLREQLFHIRSALTALNCYTELGQIEEVALAFFRNVRDRRGEGQCMQSLGVIAWLQNDCDRPRSLLKSAIALFKQADDSRGEAQCTRSLGDIAYMQNDYETAQPLLERAMTMFQATNDRLGQAQCMRSLGDVARMQNDYQKAQVLLDSALADFKQIDHRLGQAQCMRSQSDIARLQTDYKSAQALLESAMKLFERVNDRLGQAQCMQSLGNLAREQTDYMSAKPLLESAVAVFHEINHRLGEAQCMQSLGDIARIQNEYDTAPSLLQGALKAFEQVDDRLGQAQCMLSLGNLAREQIDYETGKRSLENAMTLFERVKDQLGQAQCMLSLGQILRTQGDYVNAAAMLQCALKRSEQVSSLSGQAYSLLHLGNTARLQHRYIEAHDCLQSAKSYFNALGYSLAESDSLQYLSMIALARGDYVLAEKLGAEARNIAQAVSSDPFETADCDYLLDQIAQERNTPPNEKDWTERHGDFKDWSNIWSSEAVNLDGLANLWNLR